MKRISQKTHKGREKWHVWNSPLEWAHNLIFLFKGDMWNLPVTCSLLSGTGWFDSRKLLSSARKFNLNYSKIDEKSGTVIWGNEGIPQSKKRHMNIKILK